MYTSPKPTYMLAACEGMYSGAIGPAELSVAGAEVESVARQGTWM